MVRHQRGEFPGQPADQSQSTGEVEDSQFEMSDTFVLIGFFALVVAVVSGIYFARQGAKVGAAYDAGDTGAAESIEQRIAMWSLASMGVILVTMWAMVSTWGV